MWTPKYYFFLLLFLTINYKSLFAQQINYDPAITEITDLIKTKYLEPVNIDSIINLMLNQYLSEPETLQKIFAQLDPHSNYMNATEYADLKTGLIGNFFGVGVVLGFIEDTV